MTSAFIRRLTALLVMGLATGLVSSASAQPAVKVAPLPKWKYKFIKPSETLRAKPGDLGTARGNVRKVLSGEIALADAQYFNTFFSGYYFPMMTLDEESIKWNGAEKGLVDMRVRFFREYMERAIPPIHAHLGNLALTELQKIAADDYHPSARYNAMLMIGLLNDQELIRTGDAKDKVPPSPHARALQPMLEIYNTAETPDIVRLAALIGFVRHFEWDAWRSEDRRIPQPMRTDLLDLLIGIVKAKDPPADRTSEGHQWMRRKAIDGLGYSITGKVDPKVVKVLEEVMDDEKDKAEIRTAAATAFGRANFAGVQKYDVQQAIERLAKVTEGVFQSELHRLTEQRKKEEMQVGVVGTAQGIGGGGGVPMMRQEMMRNPNQLEPDDPHFYRVEYSRRKIRAGLFGVEGALNGVDDRPIMNGREGDKNRAASGEVRGLTLLAAVKAPPQQKADKDAVERMKKEIDKLVRVIENETDGLDRESYEEALKSAAAEVSQSIGGPPPAAAPKDPAAPAAAAADPAKQPAVVDEFQE